MGRNEYQPSQAENFSSSRRWFLKGTDFNRVPSEKIGKMQEWLVYWSHACLGYLSPHKVFVEGKTAPARKVATG
jgi:IS30 family transposase